MDTIKVQLLNLKALPLLKQLEELNLIKLMDDSNPLVSSQKLSEQFRGKLSSKTVDALQKYVTQSRNEWDRI